MSLKRAAKVIAYAAKWPQARTGQLAACRLLHNQRDNPYKGFSARDFQQNLKALERTADRAFNHLSGAHLPPLLRPSNFLFEPDTRDVPAVDRRHPVEQVNGDTPPKYRLTLDMRGFTPSDVNVQVRDRSIQLTATASGRYANGYYVRRAFEHSYQVEDGVDLEKLKCTFDENCMLTVEAPFVKRVESSASGPKVTEIKVDRVESGGPDATANPLSALPGLDAKQTDQSDQLTFDGKAPGDTLPPIEQRIPAPGDDEFPKDTVDNIRHN